MPVDVELLPPQARVPGSVTSSDILVPADNDELTIRSNFDNAWNSPRSQRAIRVVVEMAVDGANFVEFASFESGGSGLTKAQIENALGPGAADPVIIIPLISAYRGKRVRVRLDTRVNGNTNVRLLADFRGHPDLPGGPPNSVAFDGTATGGAGNVSSVAWTHTPTGTPTGVAVAAPNLALSGSDNGITSITYGSDSLASIVSSAQQLDTSLTYWMQSHIWGKAGPVAGAQTVTVTFSGSGRYVRGGSVSVVGGSTSSLVSASNSSVGASQTATVAVNSAADELVMDSVFAAINTPNFVVGAGQTQRWQGNAGVASVRGAGSTEGGAAPQVTMDWPGSTPSNYVQTGISFAVEAAGVDTVLVASSRWKGGSGVLHASGTFDGATVKLQWSIDEVTWVDHDSGITQDGTISFTYSAGVYVRAFASISESADIDVNIQPTGYGRQ